MATFPVGAKVRIKGRFYDNDLDSASYDQLVDPTTVKLKIERGNDVDTTYTYGQGSEIQKTATGRYYADFVLSTVGTWHGRWLSEGTHQGTEPDWSFVVVDTEIP